MERAREKAEEVAEKTGEVIGKGLRKSWGVAKGLGKDLKKAHAQAQARGATGYRRISDEAVRTKTGKGWEEWFSILDTWRVKEKGHTKSAKHLREDYGLSPWWAQAVTIRYEWERGLRK